jgi:rRNA-processing protein FCF1
MDSDCLIKLTKASLKEATAASVEVVVPRTVVDETVGQAPTEDQVTAERVRRNLDSHKMEQDDESAALPPDLAALAERLKGGEKGVLKAYARWGVDAIATDDERFSRILSRNGIRFLSTSGILIYLLQTGALTKEEALLKIAALSRSISTQQYIEARKAIEDA